ncbi:hypothetical protein D3C85_1276130 [compost metagenome]
MRVIHGEGVGDQNGHHHRQHAVAKKLPSAEHRVQVVHLAGGGIDAEARRRIEQWRCRAGGDRAQGQAEGNQRNQGFGEVGGFGDAIARRDDRGQAMVDMLDP